VWYPVGSIYSKFERWGFCESILQSPKNGKQFALISRHSVSCSKFPMCYRTVFCLFIMVHFNFLSWIDWSMRITTTSFTSFRTDQKFYVEGERYTLCLGKLLRRSNANHSLTSFGDQRLNKATMSFLVGLGLKRRLQSFRLIRKLIRCLQEVPGALKSWIASSLANVCLSTFLASVQ